MRRRRVRHRSGGRDLDCGRKNDSNHTEKGHIILELGSPSLSNEGHNFPLGGYGGSIAVESQSIGNGKVERVPYRESNVTSGDGGGSSSQGEG